MLASARIDGLADLGAVVLAAAAEIVARRGLFGRECYAILINATNPKALIISDPALGRAAAVLPDGHSCFLVFLKRASRTAFHPARSGLTNCPSILQSQLLFPSLRIFLSWVLELTYMEALNGVEGLTLAIGEVMTLENLNPSIPSSNKGLRLNTFADTTLPCLNSESPAALQARSIVSRGRSI